MFIFSCLSAPDCPARRKVRKADGYGHPQMPYPQTQHIFLPNADTYPTSYPLRPDKPIKRKHKAAQPPQQLIPTHPELPNRVLKIQTLSSQARIRPRLPFCPLLLLLLLSPKTLRSFSTQNPDEEGDEESAEKIEGEAGVGFQAEDAGCDAKEGGG